MLKMMFEADGLSCVIKNERGSATAGYSLPIPDAPSLPWAWPEIWVNDEDYEQAIRIAESFAEGHPTNSTPWQCPNCGESVDGELTSCWNCNTDKT